jgi:hypothetical protein
MLLKKRFNIPIDKKNRLLADSRPLAPSKLISWCLSTTIKGSIGQQSNKKVNVKFCYAFRISVTHISGPKGCFDCWGRKYFYLHQLSIFLELRCMLMRCDKFKKCHLILDGFQVLLIYCQNRQKLFILTKDMKWVCYTNSKSRSTTKCDQNNVSHICKFGHM